MGIIVERIAFTFLVSGIYSRSSLLSPGNQKRVLNCGRGAAALSGAQEAPSNMVIIIDSV